MRVHPARPGPRPRLRQLYSALTTAALAAVAITVPLLPDAADSRFAGVTDALRLTSSSTFNPARPHTGIDDPVAAMPVLNRDCRPGQLDVNSASKEDLIAVLRISEPAASAVMRARPFQQSIDLTSVPGIGPSKELLLGTKSCAEPTTLPVSAPLACATGTSAVDLQSASAERIMTKTGLARPVVQRLIAARPLPQDLRQVTAPRVPGLSRPVAAALVDEGRVCVTPAPFTHAGQGWRWASVDGGAAVTAPGDSSYTLYLPPGAVSGTTGAWGRVTPLPTSALGNPRADFHLFDTGWDGEVGVRLPSAHTSTDDGSLILHTRTDGTESFSWGATVADTPGVVTTAVRSLSVFESDTFACLPTAGETNALFDCTDSPDDETIGEIAARRADSLTRAVEPTLTHGPCHDNTERVHSQGTVPFGLSCSHSGGTGPTNTWMLSNDTGASILEGLFTSTGAAYHVDPLQQGGYSLDYVPDATGYSGLTGMFKEAIALSRWNLLMSEGSLTISKPAGSGKSSFHLTSDHSRGAVAWTLANLTTALDDAVEAAKSHFGPTAVLQEMSRITGALTYCPVDLLIVSGKDAFTNCVKDVTMAALESLHQKMDGRTREAKTVKASLTVVRSVLRYGALIDNALASGIASLAGEIGEGTLTLWYDLPTAPRGPGAGHGGTNAVGGTDGTIVNDTGRNGNILVKLQGSSQAYWIEPYTDTAHGVTTTDDYYCLAHRYPLRDQLPRDQLFKYWLKEHKDPVRCDVGTTSQFFVTGNETNFILRQFAGDDGTAHAWFVDGNSRLHPIPDGGTYICLAQKYYVLDGRTDTEMTRFGPEQQDAACP